MIGIYKITNISNKKVYIGQSKYIEKRWTEHIRLLEKGKHHSLKLQRSWDKHGKNKFKFEIIEECEIDMLNIKEQYWIDYYNAVIKGFNIVNVGETPIITKQKLKNKKNKQRYDDFIIKLEELKNNLNCEVDIEYKLYKEKLLNNKYSAVEYSKVINLIDFILNYYENNYDYISEIKINRYIVGLSHRPILRVEIKHDDDTVCSYLKDTNDFYVEANGIKSKIDGDDYE